MRYTCVFIVTFTGVRREGISSIACTVAVVYDTCDTGRSCVVITYTHSDIVVAWVIHIVI